MSIKQKLTVAERRRQLTHQQHLADQINDIIVITRCLADEKDALDAMSVIGVVTSTVQARELIDADIAEIYDKQPHVKYNSMQDCVVVNRGYVVYQLHRKTILT